ncbi:hypothetical protein Val02_69020 [Virgisporangium aliadipatigenens]|uniref:HNH endonuclease n=1 Tax=Virgisporangium aliadipatigenens TaxID=741659 RepID=A0A8J3YUF3_9ACTN|nr:hypothetical protein Val02_69020 [Virgisporangium aliadipatigenens]
MTSWEGSTRRERLPDDWTVRRAHTLVRDGYRCTAVLAPHGKRCDQAATDVDHIRPGDDHDEANLTALCKWHHSRKSAAEGGRAAAAVRAPRHRPPEPHPGEL